MVAGFASLVDIQGVVKAFFRSLLRDNTKQYVSSCCFIVYAFGLATQRVPNVAMAPIPLRDVSHS